MKWKIIEDILDGEIKKFLKGKRNYCFINNEQIIKKLPNTELEQIQN